MLEYRELRSFVLAAHILGFSVAMVTTTMKVSATVEQDDIANSSAPRTHCYVNPIYTWRRRSKWTLHSCASISAAPFPASRPLVWFLHPHPRFVSLLAHSFCDIWICILFILPLPLQSLSSPENTPVYILDDTQIYHAGILVTPSPYFFNFPPFNPLCVQNCSKIVKHSHPKAFQ
jgi:hypothetical protein